MKQVTEVFRFNDLALNISEERPALFDGYRTYSVHEQQGRHYLTVSMAALDEENGKAHVISETESLVFRVGENFTAEGLAKMPATEFLALMLHKFIEIE